MSPDLQHLIALQRLETIAREAEQRLADEPARLQAFDARIDLAKSHVAAAKDRLAENQAAKRTIEKDVAMHQGRLSKFRDQAMAVKTNQEYHAVQHEIAFAEGEVKGLEDKILEGMLEADDLTKAVKQAESALSAEQKVVDAERQAWTNERTALTESVARTSEERTAVAAAMDARLLTMFELVSKKRQGIALAEARDGICTICHVRLRPQVFNTVMRNESITQCDSCNRILYYVRPAAAEPAAQPAP